MISPPPVSSLATVDPKSSSNDPKWSVDEDLSSRISPSSCHDFSSSSSRTTGVPNPGKMVGKVKKIASATLKQLASNVTGPSSSSSRRGSNESIILSNSHDDRNKNSRNCFYGSKSGMSTSSSRSLSMAESSFGSLALSSDDAEGDRQMDEVRHGHENSSKASGGSSVFHCSDFLHDSSKEQNLDVTPSASNGAPNSESIEQEQLNSSFVGSSVRTVKKLAKAGTKLAQNGTKRAVEVASAPLRYSFSSSGSFKKKNKNQDKGNREKKSAMHESTEGPFNSSFTSRTEELTEAFSTYSIGASNAANPPAPPIVHASPATPVIKNHGKSKNWKSESTLAGANTNVSGGLTYLSGNVEAQNDDDNKRIDVCVSKMPSSRIESSMPMKSSLNVPRASHKGSFKHIPKPDRSDRQLSAVLEAAEEDEALPVSTALRTTPRVNLGAHTTEIPSLDKFDLAEMSGGEESRHTTTNSSGRTSLSSSRRSSGTRRSLTRSTKVGSVDESLLSPSPSVLSRSDHSRGQSGIAGSRGSFSRSSITSMTSFSSLPSFRTERSSRSNLSFASLASMPSLKTIQDYGDFEIEDSMSFCDSPIIMPDSGSSPIPIFSLAGNTMGACPYIPFRPDPATEGTRVDTLSPVLFQAQKKRYGWDEMCCGQPSSMQGVDAVPSMISRRTSDPSESAAASAIALMQKMTKQPHQTKDVSPTWPPRVQLSPLMVQRQALEIPAELRAISNDFFVNDESTFPNQLTVSNGRGEVAERDFPPVRRNAKVGALPDPLPAASTIGLHEIEQGGYKVHRSCNDKRRNEIMSADQAPISPKRTEASKSEENQYDSLKAFGEVGSDTLPRPAQRRISGAIEHDATVSCV